MKIAILGGSFDPPHLGHIFISQQVKEFCGMDQVWLMPVCRPVFDQVFAKNLSSFDTRYTMTRFLEKDYLKISDFEKNHNPQSITINTMDLLTKKHPNDTFYWISGSDQLFNFQKYDNWQDLITRHNVIFFPREYLLPDFETKVKQNLNLPAIPKNVILLQNKNLILTNISSTAIRSRVKNGLSITNFIPEKVEKYIYDHKLYR